MPPRLQTGALRPLITSPICWCTERSTQACSDSLRQFSSTPSHHARFGPRQSKNRRQMWRWLNGPASPLKYPKPNSTNYLGAYDSEGNLIRSRQVEAAAEAPTADGSTEDNALIRKIAEDAEGALDKIQESIEDLRPFPQNPYFRSESVLSEELRTELYRLHLQEEMTVREISIKHGVEMSRVAAVIRLKTIEQDWIRQNKPLARTYHDAVMKMLPKTPFDPKSNRITRHESINDLPVHPATRLQIFYPTSESKHFTRVDAGRVFDPDLLPADDRIPHPEMIDFAKDRLAGMRAEEQRDRQSERIKAIEQNRKDLQDAYTQRLAARTKNVTGVRWDFKIENVSADAVGRDGRGAKGVGWRYGFPHEDRKRAHVKLPTHVD